MDDGVEQFIGVLWIIVTGLNEAPEFSASLFSFTIPEDAANDYTVGSVTFIDEGKNTVSLCNVISLQHASIVNFTVILHVVFAVHSARKCLIHALL